MTPPLRHVSDMTRRQLLQRGGVLWLTAVSPALLVGCDVANDAEDSDDDTLTLRFTQDLENADPAFIPTHVDDIVLLCVAENLVAYRAGSDELTNVLAEEITSTDDGLSHTFRLKQGVQFHGGFGELTAHDVKFSFERIAGLTQPKIESTYRGDWATLEEVEVTGRYTGTIRLNRPFAPLFTTTLPGSSGTIISRSAYDKLGDHFGQSPVGSGPYEFAAWKRGQEVSLNRFAHWSGAGRAVGPKVPQWREIRGLPIVDSTSAQVAVETAEVDFGAVPYDAVQRFRDDERFSITTQSTYDYSWVGFNLNSDRLSDLRVRQAIRVAIDVDSINKAAFSAEAKRAYALIPETMALGYWENAPVYQRDLKTARDLIAAAGANGLELSLTLNTAQVGGDNVAQIVQSNLADIGLTVSIRKIDTGTLLSDIRDLELFYHTYVSQADPSWSTQWFTSDMIGTWNFMSWSNEEYDELHKKGLTELDTHRRQEIYVRMQQLMDRDAVAVWIVHPTLNYAHSPQLDPSLVTPRYGKYRAWAATVEQD